jgi:hypothetical protein
MFAFRWVRRDNAVILHFCKGEAFVIVRHLPVSFCKTNASPLLMIKGGWHAYFFQMPFAEQAVMANDYEFIERWWRDASPEYDLPREVIESVKETFRQPGVVTAALNYYRHTMNPANRDPALAQLQEKVTTSPPPVPALPLHGTQDRPGRLEAFERMEEKIAHERQQSNPNGGLIGHWRAEIRAAQKKIARLQRRLAALRRKS